MRARSDLALLAAWGVALAQLQEWAALPGYTLTVGSRGFIIPKAIRLRFSLERRPDPVRQVVLIFDLGAAAPDTLWRGLADVRRNALPLTATTGFGFLATALLAGRLLLRPRFRRKS